MNKIRYCRIIHHIHLLLVLLCGIANVQASDLLDKVHFLIPAGPGGGWDGTARGVGEAMIKSGLVARVSYENLSGGGGGRAIAKLIETAPRQQNTLLISSTPMVVRSLQKIFPQSFRDLKPVASVIADYSCFAVLKDSPFMVWKDVVTAFKKNPRLTKVAGGSVRGSTDHFVIANAFKLSGGSPRDVVYVPYDGGGKAMIGLLTGETQIISTGLSEAIEMHRSGEIRILAVTSETRLQEASELPTLMEQGVDMTFANWRGFFAAPGHSPELYDKMIDTIADVIATPAFSEVRKRNGWAQLHIQGEAFHEFLEQQEIEIGTLMMELGFLR